MFSTALKGVYMGSGKLTEVVEFYYNIQVSIEVRVLTKNIVLKNPKSTFAVATFLHFIFRECFK